MHLKLWLPMYSSHSQDIQYTARSKTNWNYIHYLIYRYLQQAVKQYQSVKKSVSPSVIIIPVKLNMIWKHTLNWDNPRSRQRRSNHNTISAPILRYQSFRKYRSFNRHAWFSKKSIKRMLLPYSTFTIHSLELRVQHTNIHTLLFLSITLYLC